MQYDAQHPIIYTTEQIEEAAACLKRGELVAFPTETVFGLGAIANNEVAVARVFEAKGRPSDNPLIVHVADIEQVESLVSEISPVARQLMQTFWPGPLTIIFPAKKGILPPNITAGKSTVAIRMPNQPETLQLIEAVGFPLVGPSANVSGKPSPTCVEHVVHDFQARIAGVLQPQAAPATVGVESTVVQPREDGLYILRPGGITKSMLAQFGMPVYEMSAQAQLADNELLSPGVKYTHYSPKQPVYLVDFRRTIAEWQQAIAQMDGKVGILADETICQAFPSEICYSLGAPHDSLSATQRLYAGLRHLERSGVDVIVAQGLDDEVEVNHAYMNRLDKAATYHV
ncbi:MAG: L-threonylcarbamoyladenylate synthase [Aerococcaceae bacterium]|nr:L-threonylcarbamoyladenylate synthase [Aerococcaceae bacterium]